MNDYTATVSEKGQVTIPKALRDRLGIRPGQVLTFDEESGKLVASKAEQVDRIHAVYGILKVPYTTDEMMEMMRGPRDLPE
jgi:AbrB family looped-hinge helix DNA binding protein